MPPYLLDAESSSREPARDCPYHWLAYDLDVPGNSVGRYKAVLTGEKCAQLCCATKGCAGAVFTNFSLRDSGGTRSLACKRGAPCCHMKSSVAYPVRFVRPGHKRFELWVLPGRRGTRTDEESPRADLSQLLYWGSGGYSCLIRRSGALGIYSSS